MGFGHSDVGLLIISLILSATFLVWVGDKKGNPNQRVGVIIAIAAILLSSLFIAGRMFNSITGQRRDLSKCPRTMMMQRAKRNEGYNNRMQMKQRRGGRREMKAGTPPTE